MKKRRITKRITIFFAAVMAVLWFCACEPVQKIIDVADSISQELPSAKDTLTSPIEIIRAMEKAMSRGETELTINVASVGENELRAIGDNMSTFWGKPTHYTITNEFKDINGIIPGRLVDVKTITNTFELSYNYYAYDFIKNGTAIPDGNDRANEIAGTLPGIAFEIFADPSQADYDKALAAHDWLVANIEYDVATPSISDENGAYGALVLNRTMCQGYAEALELLLRCYTDIETVQIVGEALNTGLFAHSEDAEDIEETWRGHAWNAVRIDGAWYQIDTTFNDPIGNPSGRVTHFYFGQSDGVMAKNHHWAFEYFPASYEGDFLFFRESGLFAEDWDSFQAIVESLLAEAPDEAPVEFFEIAVRGETINEDNIQFLYKTLDNLDAILWSEQVWNDVYVHSIELVYQS